MKILHIIQTKNANGNGVAVAVTNYLKYLSKNNDVALYNLKDDIEVPKKVSLFVCKKFQNIKSLPNGFSNPDIVIFNEVYKKEYLKLYKECIRNNIPYVIIPHGCLVKRAQKVKWLKKKIANILFFNNFIKNSIAIQFLNENEKNNSIYNTHKYIISGNGISISSKNNHPKNKHFVFIGRYDVKVKGLDLLLKTIKNNIKWFNENKVVIDFYGRTAGNGLEKLKKMIKKYDISKIVKLNDAIYDVAKEKVLLDSYAFIQVSRHEGQPMGIIEALSYGLPCIVTFGTSFGEYVNENKCGIGINFDEVELFNAIKKFYDDENFRNLCSHNTRIVKKDFELNNVTSKCLKEYKKLL